jgi:hypothetical protein
VLPSTQVTSTADRNLRNGDDWSAARDDHGL